MVFVSDDQPTLGHHDKRGRFRFPLKRDISETDFYRLIDSDKVMVIGIFGKSSIDEAKTDFVDAAVQKDIYRPANDAAAGLDEGTTVWKHLDRTRSNMS